MEKPQVKILKEFVDIFEHEFDKFLPEDNWDRYILRLNMISYLLYTCIKKRKLFNQVCFDLASEFTKHEKEMLSRFRALMSSANAIFDYEKDIKEEKKNV
jgi:hypothetical protein